MNINYNGTRLGYFMYQNKLQFLFMGQYLQKNILENILNKQLIVGIQSSRVFSTDRYIQYIKHKK